MTPHLSRWTVRKARLLLTALVRLEVARTTEAITAPAWAVVAPALGAEVTEAFSLDDDAVAAEVAAGYLEGSRIPAPSVMPFNVMVAGAAVIEVLRLLTTFGDGVAEPERLSFQFREGAVRRSTVTGVPGCRVCGGNQGGCLAA
jgi:hypothetical protein